MSLCASKQALASVGGCSSFLLCARFLLGGYLVDDALCVRHKNCALLRCAGKLTETLRCIATLRALPLVCVLLCNKKLRTHGDAWQARLALGFAGGDPHQT